jgi:hypothetical protein
MKKLLCALFLLALCSSLAAASVPDPGFCTITPIYGGPAAANEALLICPADYVGSYYTITVHNSSDAAIPFAVVKIVLDAQILTCSTPVPIHEVTADVNGVAHMYLRGGGCLTNVANAVRIYANDLPIRTILGVRSPDNGAHTLCAPNLAVTAADLSPFAEEFKGISAAACHDYTMDGACTAADLAIFGAGFKGGWICP